MNGIPRCEASRAHPPLQPVRRPVGRVDDEIRAVHGRAHVLLARQALRRRGDLHARVKAQERLRRDRRLRPPHVSLGKQDLAVQVADLDVVAVEDVEPADSGARERVGGPAPEPADAEQHHPRRAQRALRLGAARARPDELAEVTQLTLVACPVGCRQGVVVGRVLDEPERGELADRVDHLGARRTRVLLRYQGGRLLRGAGPVEHGDERARDRVVLYREVVGDLPAEQVDPAVRGRYHLDGLLEPRAAGRARGAARYRVPGPPSTC